MAVAITCGQCGFLYGFPEEELRFIGPVCPRCGAYAAQVEAEVDASPAGVAGETAWFVLDRFGAAVAGPFSSESAGQRFVVRNHFEDGGHPRGPLSVAATTVHSVLVPAPAAEARRAVVPREPVPALIDALDVRLALMIAEAQTSEPTIGEMLGPSRAAHAPQEELSE